MTRINLVTHINLAAQAANATNVSRIRKVTLLVTSALRPAYQTPLAAIDGRSRPIRCAV